MTPPVAEATREIYWNISHTWIMYVGLAITTAIGGYGIYRRVSRWFQGGKIGGFDRPLDRIKLLIDHAVLQKRTLRHKYPGIFHAMIFWGMLTLVAATTVVALQADFGLQIMHGRFYLYFQSCFVDILGLIATIGLGLAAARRWGSKPEKLIFSNEATGILVLLFVIMITGFLIEGWRIAATNDPWGSWSPVGNLVGLMTLKAVSVETIQSMHEFTWWFHMVLVFGFLAWIPYTKMMHILTAPLNIYTGNLHSNPGRLTPMNFDDEEEEAEDAALGVNAIAAFTWKDRLQFDACTECGRCTDACPAHASGKALSPRDIILSLQDVMHGSIPISAETTQSAGDSSKSRTDLIGATSHLSPEVLWECTTCNACVEACPVSIEPMPKIVDLRRYLAMEKAEIPDTMGEALNSMESRGHPYRGTTFTRIDWAKELDVPHISEIQDAEILLWVGCGGSLVERNQSSTRSLAQILSKAGVKFAILGRDEKCTGDPARRMGNEFLFQTLAKENIENMNKYGVKKVVTSCPHCLNTLKNEYPELGGNFEVFHHTEILKNLVDEGKISVSNQLGKKVTFHDPCYLGRHNRIFDAPRELVQIATGQKIIEMAKSREESFCCGGGGGLSFVEEEKDKRVNQRRADQILETDAEIVAVACPFCTTMLEDGINAKKGDRKIEVKEISELLWEGIKSNGS